MPPKLITCHDIHGNPHQVDAAMLAFRPSVYALAVRDGKILLMHEMDKWCLPGGGVEKGETTLEAVRREVLEETGMIVEPERLLMMRESFFIVPPGADHAAPAQSFLFFYAVRIVEEGHDPILANAYEREHVQGCEWIEIDRAATLPFLGSFDRLRDEIIELARTL